MDRKTFLSCIIAFMTFSTAANAAIVTVQASGNISSMNSFLAGNGFFDIGDTFSLSFSYDDQAINTSLTSGVGLYNNAMLSWTQTFGTYSVQASNNGRMFVRNNFSSSSDEFSVDISKGLGGPITDSGAINGAAYGQSGFNLTDLTGAAFSSEMLSGLPLSLSSFQDLFRVSLTFHEKPTATSTIQRSVFGTITSLTVTTAPGGGVSNVPLPAAAPLMLFGTAVMGFITRRRKNKRHFLGKL